MYWESSKRASETHAASSSGHPKYTLASKEANAQSLCRVNSSIYEMISFWSVDSRMSEFKEGLYDQLVTRHVRESLDRQATLGLKSSVEALEENDYPDYLARHLIRQIKSALRGVSAEDRKQRQIELANCSSGLRMHSGRSD